jgi:hypothetical protein
MAKYVWATRGESEKEMEQARAVLFEASSLEEAKSKVLESFRLSLASEDDEDVPDLVQDYMEMYGDIWFVQELSEHTL